MDDLSQTAKKRKMHRKISAHGIGFGKNQGNIPQNQSLASCTSADPIAEVILILINREQIRENCVSLQLLRGLQILQDRRQNLGPNNFQVASALNLVGTILFQQQDYANALILFQEELRIEETLVGCEELSLSVTYNNIGRIFQETQNMTEAIRYYHRSIKFCQVLGEDCSATQMTETSFKTMKLCSTVWYNLGLIYDQLRSKREAISAFEMSLRFRKILMGTFHSDVACLLFNIGVLQMEENMLEEATSSLMDFLQIHRAVTIESLDDQKIIAILQKLATSHKNSGNLDQSLRLLRETLSVQQNSTELDLAHKRLTMGTTLREIAEVQCEQGQLCGASLTAQESVEVLKPSAGIHENYIVSDYFCSELVSSLLLLGSLMHENSEPVVARSIFYEVINVIDTIVVSNNLASSQLNQLREVSYMLAASCCAPEA